MAAKHTGVVAVSQAYDEESGEMGKTTVLAQHGEVPEELFEEILKQRPSERGSGDSHTN